MTQTIWMVVDISDKYELPVYVADSAQECADFIGTSKASVLSSVAHAKRRKNGRSKFVRVYCDSEEE